MNLLKKSTIILSMGFVSCGFFLLFLATCTTTATENPAFEQKIEKFVEENKPGSELELFNGKDLSGWSVHGLGFWSVQDGILKISGGVGYLATLCNTFEDFILTLEVRTKKKANSGVFFRARHAEGLRPWPIGYEAQIDNHDPENLTGSLYDRVKASHHKVEDSKWFTMKILAKGPSIEIQVNEKTVVETQEEEFKKGFIALQAHDFFSTVEFKSIRIALPD